MSNLSLWNKVSMTDPRHVKEITGKPYKGHSPKPHYIVRRLTEEFGPVGIGWGFTIVSQGMENMGPADVLHVAHIRLWYILDGKRGELEQVGQTKAAYTTNAGKFTVDEDAPKKSVTDALIKCASYIGFAADIFMGQWDDSGYVQHVRDEIAKKEAQEATSDIYRKAMAILSPAAKEGMKSLETAWKTLSPDMRVAVESAKASLKGKAAEADRAAEEKAVASGAA